MPLRTREEAFSCQHRLPLRGSALVVDQMEVYFKVEMAVPNQQLQKDENELKAPEKKEAELDTAQNKKKKGKWNYLKSWF